MKDPKYIEADYISMDFDEAQRQEDYEADEWLKEAKKHQFDNGDAEIDPYGELVKE